MYFLLFLTFEGIEVGTMGPYVHNPKTDSRVEYYQLENAWDDVDLFFEDNAIDEIANRCASLIDYGESDYFNSEKCAVILKWIGERLSNPTTPRYHEILEVLRDFCERAIELNTGVVIDF